MSEEPNVQFESMSQFIIATFRVRIWRTEATLDDAVHISRNKDLQAIAKDINMRWLSPTPDQARSKIFNEFRHCERIAAIEVVDARGNGAIIYPDWK